MTPPLPLLSALGLRVRVSRLHKNWTLRDLAAKSGVSERFLRELEAGRGNISVARLADVATALDVSLERLLAPDGIAKRRVSPHRARLLATCETMPEEHVHAVLDRIDLGLEAPANADKIALIGLRGAGKTTIGKKAAARLKATFVELDREVERAAGMSLADLFAIHGEAYYRRLELRVLRDVLAKKGTFVIAAGGGIVTEPETWQLLASHCVVIWLEARPRDHWNRVVAQGDQRPMQGKPQAMAELKILLDERKPLYARAHRRVDTSRLGLEAAVDAVVAVGKGAT